MPTWVIYLLAGVFIVAAVGGGYTLINHMIASRDAKIEQLEQQIAADAIDKAALQTAYDSSQLQLKTQARALQASAEQLQRIQQADAAERQRQADFNRVVQGMNVRDPKNLGAINKYQACVAANINDTSCASLLQPQ